jgi:hypothetical protein
MTPIMGQIWCEQDPRFPDRFVRIVRVDTHEPGAGVAIQRVERRDDGTWRPFPLLTAGRVSPVRMAKLSRFNGQRGGYKLHQAAP